MDVSKVKLTIGQVWWENDISKPPKYTISRVDQKWAYYTEDGVEKRFCQLDKDGCMLDARTYWDYTEAPDDKQPPIPMTLRSKNINLDDDMAFFKATQSGYCPCNIPKERCDYHR